MAERGKLPALRAALFAVISVARSSRDVACARAAEVLGMGGGAGGSAGSEIRAQAGSMRVTTQGGRFSLLAWVVSRKCPQASVVVFILP